MKVLLDTHIWIWSQVEPERLSKRLSRLLAAGDTELWLSPISIWELLLLAERRRVDLPAGYIGSRVGGNRAHAHPHARGAVEP